MFEHQPCDCCEGHLISVSVAEGINMGFEDGMPIFDWQFRPVKYFIKVRG